MSTSPSGAVTPTPHPPRPNGRGTLPSPVPHASAGRTPPVRSPPFPESVRVVEVGPSPSPAMTGLADRDHWRDSGTSHASRALVTTTATTALAASSTTTMTRVVSPTGVGPASDAVRVAVLSGELAVCRSREATLQSQLDAMRGVSFKHLCRHSAATPAHAWPPPPHPQTTLTLCASRNIPVHVQDVTKYREMAEDQAAAASRRQQTLQRALDVATEEIAALQRRVGSVQTSSRSAEEVPRGHTYELVFVISGATVRAAPMPACPLEAATCVHCAAPSVPSR
jgi:hypothetical protein